MAASWGNLLAFAALVVGTYGASDEKKVNKVFCYNSRSGEQSIYDHAIRVSGANRDLRRASLIHYRIR